MLESCVTLCPIFYGHVGLTVTNLSGGPPPLEEGQCRGGWEWTTHTSCHGEIYQASFAPRNTWLIYQPLQVTFWWIEKAVHAYIGNRHKHTQTHAHADALIERIMVILLQSAGGREIKVSVGRMMCQDGFINSEIEDSCLWHQRSF